MTDTSTIADGPESGGAPKQAADLPDVDALFPAEKPDVDELFPASVERDWRRQQMGTGWVQDALFGEKKYDNARSILGAFGSTFKEAVGQTPFGLTPETEKVLRDHGVFNDYSLGQNSILKSINEDVVRPAAVGLDALWRSFNAMLPASQAAIMRTGEVRGFPRLARDIAGFPEAYMGIAHPGEIPKTFPDVREARELGVIGEGERGWKGEASSAEGETKPQTGPGADGATVLPEINVPAEPDLHAEARALKPDLFAEYDKLAQERDNFREWISDLSEQRDGEPDLVRRAQIEKQIERVEGEIAKTAPRLEELAPQVKEAYAAARDQAGIPKVLGEPPGAAEPAEAGAAVESAPAEPGAAALAEPGLAPFSIAKDTEERLIAAGAPPEEAGLHAAWTEAYWQEYAKRFQGRKGTAEEAYRRDAAEFLGEDEDKLQRKAERAGRPAPQIDEDKLSLIQFLAHKGGLKQTGDLSAIFNGNPFVPRFGRLFREGGMTLDRAREAAVEAGYINPTEFIGRAGGENTTKVSDLLNALQGESRGRKVYRPGHGPETPFDADQEAYERSIFEDQQEGAEPHEAEEDRGAEPPSHLTEEDRRVMEELFQETGNRDTGTVHSVDASGNPQSFVDPKASQWVLYHGTPSPIPFERFEPTAANRHLSSKTEEGALFLSPASEEAGHYAGGETSLGRGEAGPRIYPVHVTPGKTRVFDLNEMALHDPEFRRIMREQHSEYANMPTSAADRERFGAIFDQRLKDWEERRKHLQELYSPENLRRMVERGEIDQEAAENAIKNPLPLDHFPGILSGAGAAIRMAREQGLDTAIIRGLKESNGGDQVVVLTPNRVRGALARDRVLYQRDEAPESHEAGRRNAQGFILRLPYEDRWGDPRFNPEDRAKALARMAEIEKMPVKTAPWADLVQAKHDIDEVIAQLLYYKPETPIEEFRNFSDVEHELYLRRKEQNLGHDDGSPRSHLDIEGVPEDIRDIVGSARAALDHMVDTDRRGVNDMLSYGREDEPKQRARPGERIRKPIDVSQTLPSGFHFMAGRKLADVPDALFPQGGWAVINWLRQEGVTVAEVQHFLLDEKLGNKKPVTREDFQQAIADRMFDFKRKTSWLNPERSDSEYDYGGTRAFTGPRIPGRGMYFERLMAFPKKLKGGEEFAPGHFESPHWDDVHKGTWASWRGSVREIPEWGKTVLGEEGQSDFMQGASVGKRPRMSEKEYLGLKADRGAYERVMDEASTTLRREGIVGIPYEERQAFYSDLLPSESHRELDLQQWTDRLAELRKRVEAAEPQPWESQRKQVALETLDKLAALRAKNERFFEPGARDKFVRTESTFTPESPIDETYVRTMVRDLVMQAIKEKADSIAIATSETTGRIQNNAGAAHFYDEQLRPALQRELRRLTGDSSITLERVKLPKAMGAPRNEKPYTVWAAKLDPAVYQGAKQKGFTLFQREPAPPFYSAVERAIENAKQDKASPQQWLGTLKNMAGVKPEEVEWLGLEDWLKEQSGQVTRAEIEHYVKSNRTLIREVQKGVLSPAAAGAQRINEELISKYGDLGEAFRRWTPEEQARFDEAHGAASHEPKTPEAVQTKYSGTVLPGGQNYREFLLTLPPRAPVRKTYTVEVPRNPSGVSADREWRILDEAGNHVESRRTEGAARQRAGELSDITAEHSAEDYTKGHFDEPNVVAHIRFDDRTIDGKKTLFIQEVQSDWHQQGRKKGYGDPSEEERKTLERSRGDTQEKLDALLPEMQALKQKEDRESNKRIQALLRRRPELRADRDAFFAALKQETVDLAPMAERIRALEAETGKLRDEIKAIEDRLTGPGVPDAPFKTTWPELTLKRMIRHAAEQGYDQISWPASAEAVAQVEGWGKIENRDGKWIIKGDKDVTPIVERYLTDLPRIANKLGKKFDAKVGKAEMDATPVFTLPLTDKLSDAAMEQGFPLFQEGDKARGKIRLRDDGPNTITLFRKESKNTLPANFSTPIHEWAHDFLQRMMRDARDSEAPEDLKVDAQQTLDWLGVKKPEDIKRRHHEKFARGWEAYMMEGRAPNQGMARVFARIREFMLAIYKNATALNVELTPQIRGVFDRLLGINPDDVVIAPDMAKAETLADIHEADAVHANPHQARDVANTVQSERDSHAGENLVEEEYERLAGVEEGIGSRAPRGPEPNRDGAESEVQPGEASGHTALGTERQGGGEAPAEGAGISAEPRAPGAGAVAEEPPPSAQRPFAGPRTAAVDKAGNIRLDNIPIEDLESKEGFKELLRNSAAENNQFWDERRGVISDVMQLRLADALGMSPDRLNMRRIGQAFNGEQIKAAEKLLVQSLTDLRASMMKARLSKSPEDMLEYATLKARHAVIQGQFSGITAEGGRAFRALRKSKELWNPELENFNDFIKKSTGQTLFQLEDEVALGAEMPLPGQLAKFLNDANQTPWQKTRSWIISYFTNNLISGPFTHFAYSVGNEAWQLFKATATTSAAASIGAVRQMYYGHPIDRVYFGEVGAQLSGMAMGLRNSLGPAMTAFKTGVPFMKGDIEGAAVMGEAAARAQTIPGKLGYVLETPSRSVTMIHTLHYGMNYEAEIARRAFRNAMKEGIDPGNSAFGQAVTDFTRDPPREQMAEAHAEALRMVLMKRPSFGSITWHLSQISNNNILAKMVMPFVQIGANMLEEGWVEHTPVGFASQNVRDTLRGLNGVAARDTQLAKMSIGIGLSGAVLGLTAQEILTDGGPSDPRERAVKEMTGWKPYSIRVGDEYIPYRKYIGPMGPLIAGVSDMYAVGHHLNEGGANKAALSAVMGFAGVIADESWARSLADFMDAAKHWDRDGEKYLRNIAADFIPFSIGLRQTAVMTDPYRREVRSMMDSLRAHIPVASQELFPVRDIFGDPMPSGTMLSWSKYNDDPVVKAMLDAEYFPARTPRKIVGVQLTDKQYDDYARISGRTFKHQLLELMQLPSFSQMPQHARLEVMQKSMTLARKTAQTTIMMQNPGILHDANEAQKKKVGVR